MLKVDLSINNADKAICDNISKLDLLDRKYFSQNILKHFRDLLEAIALKIVSGDKDVTPEYAEMHEAVRELNHYSKEYRFIVQFHDLIQISLSHYTPSYDGAESLLMKYYAYLLKLRNLMAVKYGMNILHNLEKIEFEYDRDVQEYYNTIAKTIQKHKCNSKETSSERYYIHKNKPFFVDGETFYEIVFFKVNSKISKSDRLTAYTNLELFDNYAVKLQIESDTISLMNIDVPVLIITNWEVSIRPCELNNYAKIINMDVKFETKDKDYVKMMNYLTEHECSLNDVISLPNKKYQNDFIKQFIGLSSDRLYNVLNTSREIILNNLPGANVLSYLLHNMNNDVIKNQYNTSGCYLLSNLHLDFGCIPFDKMPYATSLIGHNPSARDLFGCISANGREHELLARLIRTNSEENGELFTRVDSLNNYDNIDSLISRYNNELYHKHSNRKLEKFENHIYISGYLS